MFIGVNEEKSLFLLEFSVVMLQDILWHLQKCQWGNKNWRQSTKILLLVVLLSSTLPLACSYLTHFYLFLPIFAPALFCCDI